MQNAGHIAQGLRTEHFHSLTDTSSFHVLSVDYRGYGRSTVRAKEPVYFRSQQVLGLFCVGKQLTSFRIGFSI